MISLLLGLVTDGVDIIMIHFDFLLCSVTFSRPLPDNYNDDKLTLQVFHRNNLGIDEFLGHIEIPLQNFDVYDPPKSM